ncbi:tryptophan--tRNA ligase [Sarracenia purpurea var. burkii]
MNWGTFKNLLTDALIDHLHPIQVFPSKCDVCMIGFMHEE